MANKSLRRILLVEDDPDIQEVTMVLLAHAENFEVQACGSAAEALKIAPSFDPDLILLDVMMPGLDGRGALAAFRQVRETAFTPVIFLTARVRPGEITEYRKLGSLGVIPKPFDPDTLATTIQEMWDRHQDASSNSARREDLATLRTSYAAELPERLRAIEATAASLVDRSWDSDLAETLYEMTHRLAGSAAIYGFPAVSTAAMRVVTFGHENETATRPVDSRALMSLVKSLAEVVHHSTGQPAPVSSTS
jgi:two-component system OmpR family response regulator